MVIGTSGLTADDFAEIDAAARERSVGVIASGNFSLTAAMARRRRCWPRATCRRGRSSTTRARPSRTCPSGTARELAERLGEVRQPERGVPIDEIHGPREARGATVGGTQIHSVRLPSFVVSTEACSACPTSG